MKVASGVLLVLTVVFLNIGMWSMLRRFKSFEIVEKNAAEKVRTFDAALHPKHRAARRKR